MSMTEVILVFNHIQRDMVRKRKKTKIEIEMKMSIYGISSVENFIPAAYSVDIFFA